MKRRITNLCASTALLAILFQLSSPISHAQTTLSAGDLLFTGFNSMPSSSVGDTFSFVTMTDIESGTDISFSDRGYMSGSWVPTGGTESSITWTVGSALYAGDEVMIYGLTAKQFDPETSTFTTNGTVARTEGTSANGLSLSNVGDQVIAFQGGSGSISSSGATMIAGITYFRCNTSSSPSTWDASTCTLGPNSSAMPPGLSSTVSAYYTGRTTSDVDPTWGKFICPATEPATVEDLRSAILDQDNWTIGSGTATIALPSQCTYLSTPLPINLIKFEAKNQGAENFLYWESTAETEGDKFMVERSHDGVQFSAISEIAAKANAKSSYKFIDQKPSEGVNFYRLLLLNIDGTRMYSNVASVTVKSDAGFQFSLYPNPFTDVVNITLTGQPGEHAEITITDVAGRAVFNTKAIKLSMQFTLPKLPSGIYFVQYRDSKRSEILKVSKQ